MNLLDMRTEVLAHGFDASLFGSDRINRYLNDAYMLVCRRVDYYIDESSQQIATVAGTATFPLPANFARIRSLLDTDRQTELTEVSVRDIDRSSIAQATPNYYALDAQNIHLYPTPDGIHNLLFRYWLLPALLVGDTDTPTLPADWHRLLTEYAIGRCYWAEDDAGTGSQWEQKFATTLAEFTADQRFPSTDYPTQAEGMWESDRQLPNNSWTIYGGWY